MKPGQVQSTMPRTHAPYPPQFRQQIVELVRGVRKPFALAREFGCSAQSIHLCMAEANLAAREPQPDHSER
jgi:transposase